MDFLIEPKQLLEETRRGEVVIVDTRRPADYAKGHIPGAINFSTYDIFAMDTRADGLAAFAKDMAVRYADAGASAQRTVVLYEEQTGMRAARDAWILQYISHSRVQMLHGGLAAWRAAGSSSRPAPILTMRRSVSLETSKASALACARSE